MAPVHGILWHWELANHNNCGHPRVPYDEIFHCTYPGVRSSQGAGKAKTNSAVAVPAGPTAIQHPEHWKNMEKC